MNLKYYPSTYLIIIKELSRSSISANKKLRCEVEDLKMQVYEAEKIIASMKSNSILGKIIN
jgi:hypothetical protein